MYLGLSELLSVDMVKWVTNTLAALHSENTRSVVKILTFYFLVKSLVIRSSGSFWNSLQICLSWFPLCCLFKTETLKDIKTLIRWLLFRSLRMPLEGSLFILWQPFCASHIQVPEKAGGVSTALLSTLHIIINTQWYIKV